MDDHQKTDRDYLEPNMDLVSWSPSQITLDELRVDPEDVARFLAHLATEGNIAKACRYSRVSRTVIRRLRADVPEFVHAFGIAMENAVDVVDAEIFRRAVRGVRRPVFQGGKNVGSIMNYSDRLLELRAKAFHPAYKDVGRSSFNVNAQAAAVTGSGAVGPPIPPMNRTDDMKDHELTLGEGIAKLLKVAQVNKILPANFRVDRDDEPPDPGDVADAEGSNGQVNGQVDD